MNRLTLGFIVLAMSAFYVLFGRLPNNRTVAVGFYLFGLIIGILLISQFWTLANDVVTRDRPNASSASSARAPVSAGLPGRP